MVICSPNLKIVSWITVLIAVICAFKPVADAMIVSLIWKDPIMLITSTYPVLLEITVATAFDVIPLTCCLISGKIPEIFVNEILLTGICSNSISLYTTVAAGFGGSVNWIFPFEIL